MKKLALALIALGSLILCLNFAGVLLPIGSGPVSKDKFITSPNNIFPKVTGMNLEAKEYNLPQDLEGDLNILLIAFKRRQQYDVNTWLESLGDYVAEEVNLELYEIPTLQEFNFVSRFNINNGMRYGIPSKASREHTITLYLDKESFRSRLSIENEDDIHCLLINRDGEILWRIEGLASQEKIKGLKDAIQKAKTNIGRSAQ